MNDTIVRLPNEVEETKKRNPCRSTAGRPVAIQKPAREKPHDDVRPLAMGSARNPLVKNSGVPNLPLQSAVSGEKIACMAECVCTADFCNHNGLRCGKPATFTVDTHALVNKTEYGPYRRVGICEDCWAKIEAHLPFLFGSDR